ncbi:MAG: hypothetical protein LBH78_00230 [Rickettsiales bacterium]|jgi:hypothetical protein|nr:hypothetical protein [Rickettsiales bacterium]
MPTMNPQGNVNVEQIIWNRGSLFFEHVSFIVDELYSLWNQAHDNTLFDRKKLEEVINSNVLSKLKYFKETIDGKEKHPLFTNFTIVKFYRSIIENEDLRKELEELGTPTQNSNLILGAVFRSQLEKIIADFKLENLREKMRLLKELKEKNSFAALRKDYGNEWLLRDLIYDEDFKQKYIDKVIGERDKSISDSLEKGIDKCKKLAKQGEDIASKYFGEWEVNFQAYCEETDNANRTLNVNLTNYNGSEPIKISDILQQEKDIGKLNIYCNKKHDIFAHREDKKRHYEFKEGACYQMTSTWPIKDESGRVAFTCIMVMDVSSEGITEAKFSGKKPNGESCELSLEEDMELIKQNEELYIGNLSLCEAVEEFLGTQRNKEDIIRKGKDREHNSAPVPGVVPKNVSSNPTTSNNDPPVQTEANSCDAEIQIDICEGAGQNCKDSPRDTALKEIAKNSLSERDLEELLKFYEMQQLALLARKDDLELGQKMKDVKDDKELDKLSTQYDKVYDVVKCIKDLGVIV